MSPANVLLPEPDCPTIEIKLFSFIVIFIFFRIVLSSLYPKLRLLIIMFSFLESILFILLSSSFKSSISNIFSLAAIPFIAI